MGPALKQLFETVKQNHISDDADVLAAIFDRHGEALIDALEQLVEISESFTNGMQCDHEVNMCVCGELRSIRLAKQLLAQLEAEAQP